MESYIILITKASNRIERFYILCINMLKLNVYTTGLIKIVKFVETTACLKKKLTNVYQKENLHYTVLVLIVKER